LEKRIGRRRESLLHFGHGYGIQSDRRRVRRAGFGGPLLAVTRAGGFGTGDRAVRARPRPRRLAGPLAHHPARPAPVRVRRPRPPRLRGLLRDRTRIRRSGAPKDRRPDHRGSDRTGPGEGRHPQRRGLRRRLRGARLRLRGSRPRRADDPLATVPPWGVGARDLSVRVRPRGRREVQRRARRAGPRPRRDGARRDPRPGRPAERRGRGGRHRRRDLPRGPGSRGERHVDERGLARGGSAHTADRHPGAGDLLRHAEPEGVLPRALPRLHVAREGQLLRVPRLRRGCHQAPASTWAATR